MAAAVGHDKLMLGLDGTWAPIKVSGEKIFVIQDTRTKFKLVISYNFFQFSFVTVTAKKK